MDLTEPAPRKSTHPREPSLSSKDGVEGLAARRTCHLRAAESYFLNKQDNSKDNDDDNEKACQETPHP